MPRSIVLASTTCRRSRPDGLREHCLPGGARGGVPAGRPNTATPQRHGSEQPPAPTRCGWVGRLGEELAAAVALGSGSYLAVDAGASGLLADGVGGRQQQQRSCTDCVPGRDASSPCFDRFDNLYIGRARRHDLVPVDAVDPLRQRGARDADDAKDSRPRAPAGGRASGPGAKCCDGQQVVDGSCPLDLVASVRPNQSGRGFADCMPPARCPVATAPAFSGRPESSCWVCGRPDADPTPWSGCAAAGPAPVLTRGIGPATPSSSGPLAGPCCRLTDRPRTSTSDEALWAINARDGEPRSSVPLDYLASTRISVAQRAGGAGSGPDARS